MKKRIIRKNSYDVFFNDSGLDPEFFDLYEDVKNQFTNNNFYLDPIASNVLDPDSLKNVNRGKKKRCGVKTLINKSVQNVSKKEHLNTSKVNNYAAFISGNDNNISNNNSIIEKIEQVEKNQDNSVIEIIVENKSIEESIEIKQDKSIEDTQESIEIKSIENQNQQDSVNKEITAIETSNIKNIDKNNIVVMYNNQMSPTSDTVEQVEALKLSEENVTTSESVETKEKGFPTLSIDMIGTSYKVMGDLPPNTKMKIIDNTHLAVDNGYLSSISRYSSGQGRDKIIGFLDHLYTETVRNITLLLYYIRNSIEVDTNISVLQGLLGKIYVFLHRFENMRNVYKSDSSAFARLGIIRDKYFTYLNTLYRDMLLNKKN